MTMMILIAMIITVFVTTITWSIIRTYIDGTQGEIIVQHKDMDKMCMIVDH